jgi:hypothetical protein
MWQLNFVFVFFLSKNQWLRILEAWRPYFKNICPSTEKNPPPSEPEVRLTHSTITFRGVLQSLSFTGAGLTAFS